MSKKIAIELPVKDVICRGREWVKQQMLAAGMRLYPYRWVPKGPGVIVVEGVAA